MAARATSIFTTSATVTFACQEQLQYSAVNQSNRNIFAVERNCDILLPVRATSIFSSLRATATLSNHEIPLITRATEIFLLAVMTTVLAARAIAIFCSPKATGTVCLWRAATVTVCLPRSTKIFCAQPERTNHCILLAARACQETACLTTSFCAQQEHLRSFALSLAESNCNCLLADCKPWYSAFYDSWHGARVPGICAQ
jgi:hypothetical protein